MEFISTIWAYLPRILEGAWMTLQIAVVSVFLALFVGLGCALMRMSRHWIFRGIATTYSVVVRGVPDLIWIMLIYFGAQIGLNQITDALAWDYIDLSPYAAGILTLTFIFGAFYTETFRGAYMAIPRGQVEAAHAYGMSRATVLRRVTFPLMMRYALPSIKNNWLVLTKATALISVIGLDDMTRVSQAAGSTTHMGFAFNMISALLYLLITYVSLKVFEGLDRRYQRGFELEAQA